jgi:molecular chaperone GrpE
MRELMAETNSTDAKEIAPEGPQGGEAQAVETELAKARDELLRALAEVENTRRRAERQANEARAYAVDRFARDLLPVADTLARAIEAAPSDWRESADEGLRTLLTGLEMTERAMLEAFARHGLKKIGAAGETFDPNLHQAVAQTPSDQPAGTVLVVMQPGFVLADRTLRAAMVSVSAGPGGGAQAHKVDIKV